MMQLNAQESNNLILWKKLRAYCGQDLAGEYISPPNDITFAGKIMVIHLKSCGPNRICIHFNVAENQSRTLVFPCMIAF